MLNKLKTKGSFLTQTETFKQLLRLQVNKKTNKSLFNVRL